MARKKVELKFITNDSKRKATFKKRKDGLMKKVNEIKILCGIEACVIIYAPNDPEPKIWPSVEGVQKVLTRFMEDPKSKQWEKMYNQETFLRQKIMKTQQQLNKLKNGNKIKEMTFLMFQCFNNEKVLDNATMATLNDLLDLIDQYMKDIERQINLPQVMENIDQRADMYIVQEVNQNNGDHAIKNQLWNAELINNVGVGASTGVGVGVGVGAGENEFLSFGNVDAQNGF